MAPADHKHFGLVHDFVHRVGTECRNTNEVMTVLESMITGCMLVGSQLHKLEPQHASALAEVAIQRAIERFAAADLDIKRSHRSRSES